MIKQVSNLAISYLVDPKHWIKNIIWRFPTTISSQKVVFVIGAPRSGTTLLQNIIASHDELFSIEGETGIFSYQNLFAKNRKHFGLSDEEIEKIMSESKDIVDFFQKGINVISKQNGNKIFIEKTPQHILYLEFLLKHFPNAKFVHIVRDGRDAFCSARKHSGIQQNTSLKRYVNYWKKCVSCPMLTKNTSALYTVKYEDLSNNPKVEIEKVMKFLALSFQEKQVNPNSFGMDKRADCKEFEMLKSPISPKSVNKWKTELTDEEKKIFLEKVSRQLMFYGYST